MELVGMAISHKPEEKFPMSEYMIRLAAKYQNTFGQTLENEKNVDLHSFCLEAYFITIINVADSSKGYIGAFKDNCLEALRGYTKVWDNAHVTVMTYEQARRKLPFVV